MGYLHYAFHEAWEATWETLTGGYMALTVVGISSLIAAYFTRKLRGKEQLKEILWSLFITGLSAIVTGILLFVVELFVIVPMHTYADLQTAKNEKDKATQALAAQSLNAQGEEIKQLQSDLDAQKTESASRIQKQQNEIDSLKNSNSLAFLQENIASATATATVRVQLSRFIAPFPGLGNRQVILSKSPTAIMLVAETNDPTSYLVIPSSDSEHIVVEYRTVCIAPVDSEYMGKPIESLLDANEIQVELWPIMHGTTVMGGNVVWVINDHVTLKFDIPAQIVNAHNHIFINDLTRGLAYLRGQSSTPLSSNPDTSSTSSP